MTTTKILWRYNSDSMILYDNNKDLVEIYNRDFYVYMSLYSDKDLYGSSMIHVPMSYIQEQQIAIVPEKKANKTNTNI